MCSEGNCVDDFEKELKLGFLDEAAQAVSDVEQCFLSMETDSNNQDNLNKIFRLAHNLKGSSKAVGFSEFGRFTHEFETFILKIKNGELQATAPIVNLLLRANDFVLHMINELKSNLDAQFDFEALLIEMRNPPVGDASQEVSSAGDLIEASLNSQAETTESIAQEIQEAVSEQAQATETENTVLGSVAVEPPPKIEKESEKSVQASLNRSSPQAVDESIRVSLSKVETLINFVGEMVILQSVMREQALRSGSSLLIKTVHQLEKVSKEIQDTSMSLRMTPIKPTFQKMVRIVRDTAQALEKDVNLSLEGEETELDKTVLEKINDPLVHLIRNAVDHGIESKEKRLAAGKPEKGQIRLRAFHQSGRLIIEVKDDGGGLNPDFLIKKAQDKGILKQGHALSEKEAYQLIFAPGFSTKEQVTDVSGRGVGMDVVKTNIKEIGGEIQIESQLQKGTTFRIVLPLTLAILDAMVVTYGESRFVLPLSHVHETVPTRDYKMQKSSALGDVLMLRGENLKLFRLGDFFGLKSNVSQENQITIVVRTGPEPFGITVDDIIGQFQIVLKQLGPELQGIKGVTGSTILGDGKPALILEPIDLLKRKLTLVSPGTKSIEEVRSA